jgi:RNA polymerase sigma factor (TIGR02999 family)
VADFDDIYSQLKLIAKRELARHQRSTLNTTALVHEAFVKLAHHDDELDRAHRINLVAKAMRQITVDHARAKQTHKRRAEFESLDEPVATASLMIETDSFDLVAFDQALAALAQQHPRMARVMELSYFAGVASEDIAEVLAVNVRTVQRDLIAAKALLQAELLK